MNGSWRLIDQYAALHAEFNKLGYTASWDGEKFVVSASGRPLTTATETENEVEDDLSISARPTARL